MFGPGGSFFVWVGGMNGGRDERTVCQRGGGVDDVVWFWESSWVFGPGGSFFVG